MVMSQTKIVAPNKEGTAANIVKITEKIQGFLQNSSDEISWLALVERRLDVSFSTELSNADVAGIRGCTVFE